MPARSLHLLGDGPDESGESAGDGDDGLVFHHPSGQQALELGVQAQLRLPGDVGDFRWQLVLSRGDDGADAGAVLVVPGDVDERAPGRRVAGLGDAALARLEPDECSAGTGPTQAMSWRGDSKRMKSCSSVTSVMATIS